MDTARCRCPRDSAGTKCGRNPACAIHGDSGQDPLQPYALNYEDKKLLRSFRIDPEDTAAIQDVRKADEERFRRD